MTTFLEYVVEKLLGPPTSRGDRSVWPCPQCDDRTAFSTLPHKPEYKDRYHCHRCGFRGDEYDLCRHFFPREPYPVRQERLAAWREDFDISPSFPPGTGKHPAAGTPPSADLRGVELLDPTSVELAYRGLSREERWTLAKAVHLARGVGVNLEALAYFCWHSAKEVEQRLRQQLAVKPHPVPKRKAPPVPKRKD